MLQSTINNRTLFCKDNLDVLQNIDSHTIDLIYLDPPFNKKKVFTAPIGSSAEGASFKDYFREEDVKDEWLQTIKEDQIELYNFLNGVKNISSNKQYLYNYCYLAYMAIRLLEMHRILKDTGSLYFHCDPTMSHYIKLLMDIIFGEKNFRNEIVWHYYNGATSSNKFFGRKHDLIIFYVKNEKTLFKNIVREPYEKTSGWVKYNSSDPIKYGKPNPEGKRIHDVWKIPSINNMSKERTGYPTQKPLALLNRIIKASSNKGDLVLDPFCGCATTCIAAEQLNRQWIGIDVSVRAYELVKDRLKKEIKGEQENGQRDLLNYAKEVYFTTNPPKRTDIQDGDNLLRKYVYIISNPKYKGEYKVGIAKDWKARLNTYQTSDPDRNYKLEYKKYTTLFRPIEKHIHAKFENKHEWVRGKLNDIIQEIENYKV